MNSRRNSPATAEMVRNALSSPLLATTITLTTIALAFSTHMFKSVVGWPGLLGALVTLVIVAALSLFFRRKAVELHGLLPISVLVFVGWCTLSTVWSGYPLTTLAGVAYQLAFGFLAVYIALVRDSIQIVRSTGDVLRVLLGLSIVLEVVSGLLLDLPIAFLGINGNIDKLGPVEGVFGSRNALGLVSLIAAITFVVEWRSRSVPRSLGIGSVWLAGICLLLTRSPVILVVTLFVVAASVALYFLRRTAVERRWKLQLVLLGGALLSCLLLWVARARIVELLNAGTEFEARITLWREMWRLVRLHPLEGWGWAGLWPQNVTPYGWFEFMTGHEQVSGLNAFLDVYFQIGLVGFLALVALVGLAVVRSWLLASSKRSLVYVWPPLILIALLISSAAESTMLVEIGWMLLVICSVKASQNMSWRNALARRPRMFEE